MRLRGAGALASIAVVLGGPACLGVLFAGCTKKPELTFDLTIPASVAATWIEVGAWAGSCPPPAQLGGGLPANGALTRAAFRVESGDGPVLGDLPRGTYAFMAVAKGDDCGVLATGCSNVDVGDTRSVAIGMRPTDAVSGACTEGAVCQNARCLPGLDNAGPGVGANCSLQLIGAGPLAEPLANTSLSLSAPAITATSLGFLVAYREYDPGGGGSARLALVPIDNGGGVSPPIYETLADRCTKEESDATGMAFNGDVGMVAVTRPDCGAVSAGIDLFQIDAAGIASKRTRIRTPAVTSLLFSTAHALAPIAGTSDFYLAALRDGRAALSQTRGAGDPTNAIDFGGTAPMTSAMVAASDKKFAVVATGGPRAATADADAGVADDAAAVSQSPTIRVQIGAPGGAGPLPEPTVFDGTWASVAAQSTRVFVVTEGTGIGRVVAVRFFDDADKPPRYVGFSPDDSPEKALFADVAVRDKHLFVAVEQPGAITLGAFGNATSTPSELRQVSLARDPRIPSISRVREGRIAVAASDTRVAVAWTTGAKLGKDDVVGGYAVFACRAD